MAKILIVEDEKSLSNPLREKLTLSGFKVAVAYNGAEGLKKAEKEKPDLILLDIVMPVMDGLTMLRKLRENAWGKNIEVIMLTNLSDSAKIAEAIKEGSYDYLVKSTWKLEDIIKKISDKVK